MLWRITGEEGFAWGDQRPEGDFGAIERSRGVSFVSLRNVDCAELLSGLFQRGERFLFEKGLAIL